MYDRLPSYLSAADLFAMPSRSRFFGLEVEGLGIVYLEASACGIPVVAGNSGEHPMRYSKALLVCVLTEPTLNRLQGQ